MLSVDELDVIKIKPFQPNWKLDYTFLCLKYQIRTLPDKDPSPSLTLESNNISNIQHPVQSGFYTERHPNIVNILENGYFFLDK